MNIFKILANGDGTINEANISAFLGYLLDPYQDHGLGFEFLERFFKAIIDDDLEFDCRAYDYEVVLESGFKGEDNKNNIVDITILCFKIIGIEKKQSIALNLIRHERKLEYIFLIENKIKHGSITIGQLQNQFNATIGEINKIDKIDILDENIYSVYLTPFDLENNNKKINSFSEEFNSLENKNKVHLFWSKNSNSIYNTLKNLLVAEANGEIEAINEYTKHTLISFIKFIDNDFKSKLQQNKDEKTRQNDGTYSKQFIDLNEMSKIEEKLNKLREELIKLNPDWNNNLKMADLSKPRSPQLIYELNEIDICLYAGALDRKSISFIYRSNSRNENSFNKLKEIAEKLNTAIKKANYPKDAYTRTKEMNEIKYDITDFNSINSTLHNIIKQIN